MYDKITHTNKINSYVDEKTGRVIDLKWETMKIMASTAKQVPENDQFSIIDGKRVYHTAEGQRRTDFRLASSQPLKCEAEILSQQQRIQAQEDLRRLQQQQSSNNNPNINPHVRNHNMPLSVAITARALDQEKQTVTIRTGATADNNNDDNETADEMQPKYVSVSNSGIRDADQPLSWKWAATNTSSLPPNIKQQRQKQEQKEIGQGFTSSFAESPENLNYSADFATAETVVNELKKRELASGREYSAQDLEQLIREKYKGLNDNIVAIAVDMIMNDVDNMQSRVSGVFPNIRLLVSARNTLQPSSNQVQNRNQQLQQTQPQPQGNNRASEMLPQDLQNKINALSDEDKQTLQQVASQAATEILNQAQGPIPELQLEQQISQQYYISSMISDLIVEVFKALPEYSKKVAPQQKQNQQNQNQNQNQNQQQQQRQQQQQPSENPYRNASWRELRDVILNYHVQ